MHKVMLPTTVWLLYNRLKHKEIIMRHHGVNIRKIRGVISF
jgi:hypothetical protein